MALMDAAPPYASMPISRGDVGYAIAFRRWMRITIVAAAIIVFVWRSLGGERGGGKRMRWRPLRGVGVGGR